jgi:hypothetical protein
MIRPELTGPAMHLVSNNWARLRKAYNRKEKAMLKEKAAFENLWTGKVFLSLLAVFLGVMTSYSAAATFGEGERIKKKKLKKLGSHHLRKITQAIAAVRRVCGDYFPKEWDAIDKKVACFLGILKHGGAFKGLDYEVPEAITTILHKHRKLTAVEVFADYGILIPYFTSLTGGEVRAGKKLAKKSKIIFDGTTQGDVQACELHLQHFFERIGQTSTPLTLPPTAENMELNQLGLDNEGDLGVVLFKNFSKEELWRMLQMPNGRPPIFNSVLAKNRAHTPWDLPTHTLPEGEETEPCAMLWHQSCGVSAIAMKAWVSSPAPPCTTPGMMLADGVGVGKTLQITSFIGLAMCVRAGEVMEPPAFRPPLIGEQPLINPGHVAYIKPIIVGRKSDILRRASRRSRSATSHYSSRLRLATMAFGTPAIL